MGARCLHANIHGGKVAYTVEEINEIVKWMIAFRSRIEKREEGSVTTEMLSDGAVTPEKLNERVTTEMIDPIALPEATRALVDEMAAKGVSLEMLTPELQRMLSKAVPVSLEVLNKAMGQVYGQIEDITGVPMQGIDMKTNRNYYVGEEGEDITITITPPAEGGGYDHVKVLDGETVLLDEDNVTEVRTLNHHVSESTTIRCVVTILGVEYEAEQPISKITAFYIGGGETAADVMTEDCHRTIVGGSIDGEYEVEMGDGDYLFIVMDVAYRDLFHRADMNGFEIPMKAMTEVTIEGSTYVVGQSENQYNEGEYSIYINR